jgi:hypothetical protein
MLKQYTSMPRGDIDGGAWCWRRVAQRLTARGTQFLAPLVGAAGHDLDEPFALER